MKTVNKTKKTAVCAMISALSAVLMLTAYFPYFTYCSPLAAGALMVVIVVEFSKKWAIASYAVVSVISLLLCEKEAALMFALFFGYYPILKAKLEGMKSKAVEYIIKFLTFNAGVVTATLLALYLFKIPVFEGEANILIFSLLLLAVGNILFIGYDIALTKVVLYYIYKLQPKIRSLLR